MREGEATKNASSSTGVTAGIGSQVLRAMAVSFTAWTTGLAARFVCESAVASVRDARGRYQMYSTLPLNQRVSRHTRAFVSTFCVRQIPFDIYMSVIPISAMNGLLFVLTVRSARWVTSLHLGKTSLEAVAGVSVQPPTSKPGSRSGEPVSAMEPGAKPCEASKLAVAHSQQEKKWVENNWREQSILLAVFASVFSSLYFSVELDVLRRRNDVAAFNQRFSFLKQRVSATDLSSLRQLVRHRAIGFMLFGQVAGYALWLAPYVALRSTKGPLLEPRRSRRDSGNAGPTRQLSSPFVWLPASGLGGGPVTELNGERTRRAFYVAYALSVSAGAVSTVLRNQWGLWPPSRLQWILYRHRYVALPWAFTLVGLDMLGI